MERHKIQRRSAWLGYEWSSEKRGDDLCTDVEPGVVYILHQRLDKLCSRLETAR